MSEGLMSRRRSPSPPHRRRLHCRMTTTSSWRSSSASLHSLPHSPVPPSSASAGAASFPTPDSSASSANTATVQIEESGLGLAALTGSKSSIIQIWARKINYDGVFRWVLQKTVELDKLLPLGPSMKKPEISFIRGFDEVTNAIILSMVDGVGVMIQLESLKFRNLCTPSCTAYYPYRNFCTAGLFKGKLQEDIQAGADHVQQEESSESSKD